MRSRFVLLICLVFATAAAAVPVAHAAPLYLAQAPADDSDVDDGDLSDPGTDTDQGTGGGSDTDGGEEGGEGQPDAETGAGEDEQGDVAETEEEGPQWTYQMSKITLVMLLLLFLAMGALYYRMIARRQRGA